MEKDNDGRTWIHHSARKTEPLECLKTLLTPESMKLRDNEGRTCLHVRRILLSFSFSQHYYIGSR